jgi:hypothetical protein
MSNNGYYITSPQRYAVTLQNKNGIFHKVEFNDRPSAERYFARKQAWIPGITASLNPIPRYRVEWRNRATGETGHRPATDNEARAWNVANRLNDLYAGVDHWVSAIEDDTP